MKNNVYFRLKHDDRRICLSFFATSAALRPTRHVAFRVFILFYSFPFSLYYNCGRLSNHGLCFFICYNPISSIYSDIITMTKKDPSIIALDFNKATKIDGVVLSVSIRI